MAGNMMQQANTGKAGGITSAIGGAATGIANAVGGIFGKGG
jgi:hypothetical protein